MCYANIYYIMHRNIIIIIIILFKSGNKAHNIHRRHTDRQTDSVSKRKKAHCIQLSAARAASVVDLERVTLFVGHMGVCVGGRVCSDIDECATMNCTGCCVNTEGSFNCEFRYYKFNNSECRGTCLPAYTHHMAVQFYFSTTDSE